MSELKLEVGRQYRTRDGWRCVVVLKREDGFDVWHAGGENVWSHWSNGEFAQSEGERHMVDFDIIEEWTEPQVYEASLVLDTDGNIYGSEYPRKELEVLLAHEIRITIDGDKKTIEFVEGE